MQKISKMFTKIILSMFFIATLIMVFPQASQAATGPTDMTLGEGGIIRWEAYSQNSKDSGWKFYTKFWRFTIKQTINGKSITQNVDVYQTTDIHTGFTSKKSTEIIGETEKYHHYFEVSISLLEELSGLNLGQGKVEYIANAGIGFRYKDGEGNYSKYDNGTYVTQESFNKKAKTLGFSNPEKKYRGFYNKHVEQKYFPVTITSDNGYETDGFYGTYTYKQPNGEMVTKSFTASKDAKVWVPIGSNISVSGTAKYGYKANESKPISNIQSNRTITLTSTPWKHTVTFDLNGGNGKPDDFTKIYTEVKYLPIQTPTKAGYTFTGWKSSVTGTVYQPEQLYSHSQDGGTDILVAQWKENEYTFVFDGNGGEGTMPPITKKYTDSFKLPECIFVNGESVFMGWDADSGAMEATYKVGDKAKVKDIVSSLGYDFVNGATINIYALWNLAPRISAVDRYFSLWEAQNGHITEEELFGTASAYDMEDGEIVKGEQFYLESYYADLYTGFTDSASCTETYVAIDSAGNKIEKTITVHVANTETQESIQSSKYNYVRAISLKYLDYPASDGGLMNNSIWREKANYEYLKSVLQIKRINPEIRSVSLLGMTVTKEVPGTGEWNAPIEQHWKFTKEDADKVKEFIRIHGFGNSKEPGALKLFLKEFAYCRLK